MHAILLTNDLMGQSRITSHPNMKSFQWLIASNPGKVLEHAQAQAVAYCVLDLELAQNSIEELVNTLKEHSPETVCIGYGPHVRVDLLKNARQAGVTHVVPNSQLDQLLATL